MNADWWTGYAAGVFTCLVLLAGLVAVAVTRSFREDDEPHEHFPPGYWL